MLEELAWILTGTGLPVTYRAWPTDAGAEVPPMPYICYRERQLHHLRADGGVYHTWGTCEALLYTAVKDPAAENKVEAALAGLHWNKFENYIEAQRCYVITYEIEV